LEFSLGLPFPRIGGTSQLLGRGIWPKKLGGIFLIGEVEGEVPT